MQTITFYSYNGGTGRTLAVAHAAKHLLRLGQRVFAIDFDLEAPGLHHKLGLGTKSGFPQIKCGLVDYIHTFVTTKSHSSLREHTIQIQMEEGRDGYTTLMPAGNAPCSEYWRKLTQIDWHKLFYSNNPEGIPFFLELKARIEKEFAPDFLLIDSRTGITEIGGIATTVLPDQVVCLVLRNKQNLEGSRAVLQGIANASRFDGKPLEIIPVLSRIPWMPKRAAEFEEKALAEVKAALAEKSPDKSDTFRPQDVLILHTDRSLEMEERLLIGGGTTYDQSPLLRDYLRLFSKNIPAESVAPHLDKLISTCLAEMIDRPEKVEDDLEALVENCPHQKTFLALLKYYRVRQAGSEKLLRAAAGYWELSRDSANPLLWEIVSQHFRVEERERGKAGQVSPEFVEAVWADAGAFDLKVGLRLADFYFNNREDHGAVNVLKRMLDNSSPNAPTIVASISKLVARDQIKLASELIEKHKAALLSEPDFQVEWARLIIKKGDSDQAKELVKSKDFRPAKLQAEHPLLYIRLLSLTGPTEELIAALRNALEQALVEREMSTTLIELGAMFGELGQRDFFRKRVQEVLPKSLAEHVLEMLPQRGKSLRFVNLPDSQQ